MDQPLTDDQLDALRALDTPTVCNALEVVAPNRRGHGYTVQPFFC
ncbi:MAG: RraA family protein, partial [Actinomycetota bacterium]